MSKLVYITSMSLDGYVEDETGAFDWVNPEKIVFSRTLGNATTRKTRLERNFDVQAIQKLKRESAHDINIGGAELAGVALDADLVDECHLFVNPKTRRFDTGVVYLRYNSS